VSRKAGKGGVRFYLLKDRKGVFGAECTMVGGHLRKCGGAIENGAASQRESKGRFGRKGDGSTPREENP